MKATFEEIELTMLRSIVEKSEQIQGEKIMNSPETKKMINLVEEFISKHKCIVYGGTAINNILPKEDQFYDYNYELPDYDFFSPNAFKLAKTLANLYVKHGFKDVEAKSGIHKGTYKVFVNFIGIADITYIQQDIYETLKKSAILKHSILYAPVNFLRQSMFLEMSSPMGDVSRWEKIFARLKLLNKHYPLKATSCETQDTPPRDPKVFQLTKQTFMKEGVVFIGGYANSKYLSIVNKTNIKNVPDFDVLSTNPQATVKNLIEVLSKAGYHPKMKEYKPIDDMILKHYSVSIDDSPIAFVYEPIACHSYHVIKEGNHELKIGTIYTLLCYYLAFMYANRYYFDENRLLCLSSVLFSAHHKNRLSKGILKSFVLDCYGNQKTLMDIMKEKSRIFAKLSHNSTEYKERFFRYVPKKNLNATYSVL
jgi:hypothetical protein